MKEILVIYYSQSGQLFDILKNIASGIGNDKANVTYFEVVPEKEFGFPWKSKEFFDAFPESFLQIPAPFKVPDISILQKKYDLVILGYTVWFLSPSIPITSFLKSDIAKKVLGNAPVITVIGCRNMWIMAQEKMKKVLLENQANLVGNIVLVDRNINHVSVITIVHWMFGGKKTRMWRIFPMPGVSQKDIDAAQKFGKPIERSLVENDFSKLQEKLLLLDAVHVKPLLIATDKRANVIFSKWSAFIRKKGLPGDSKRKKWLVLFKYYLLFAIWFIGPIVFVVFLLTYIPSHKKIKREKAFYSSVATKDFQ